VAKSAGSVGNCFDHSINMLVNASRLQLTVLYLGCEKYEIYAKSG